MRVVCQNWRHDFDTLICVRTTHIIMFFPVIYSFDRFNHFQIKILLNQQNLEGYCKQYKSTVNVEKLRRIKSAISFIMHEQEED